MEASGKMHLTEITNRLLSLHCCDAGGEGVEAGQCRAHRLLRSLLLSLNFCRSLTHSLFKTSLRKTQVLPNVTFCTTIERRLFVGRKREARHIKKDRRHPLARTISAFQICRSIIIDTGMFEGANLCITAREQRGQT